MRPLQPVFQEVPAQEATVYISINVIDRNVHPTTR